MRQLLILFIVAGVLLSGCSTLGLAPVNTSPTPTPLATANPEENLRVIPQAACLVTRIPTIQADKPAGDMMAFSPDSKTLAYIAPYNSKWGWFTGNLTLFSTSTGESRATRDLKVTGDITWSPDGSRLAFTALHTTENLYTVMVLSTSDFTPMDLYAAGAATDDFGSAKGIVAWDGNNQIKIDETCGVDCSRVVEINISGQGQQVLSTGRRQDNVSLNITLNPPSGAVNPDWLLVNASPDGTNIFFMDKDDQTWVVSPDDKTKYHLILDQETVQESKWSPDSQLLAVRTNENLFLFDLGCTLQLPTEITP